MDRVQTKLAIDEAIDKELRRLRKADILRSDKAVDEVEQSIRMVIVDVMKAIAFPRPTCVAVDKLTMNQCGQPLHHRTEMHENGLRAMSPWRDQDCTPESLAELNRLRVQDGVPTQQPPLRIHDHLLVPYPEPAVEPRPADLASKETTTVSISSTPRRRGKKNDNHSGNGGNGNAL
jgi:hypothetical protein